MDVGTFLQAATQKLTQAGIQTARLDSLVLLSDALGCDKAAILAHPEKRLTNKQKTQLNLQVDARATHTPLAYIRGKAMFYGREFTVSPAVLTPRPESESIIELLVQLPLPHKPRIADIGTGSGCIGLTAALELPQAHVDLYDISEDALGVACKNNKQLQAGAACLQSDLLQSVTQYYDVLLANLPYVPDAFPINAAAKHEPALALFSGADGLDHYRHFWAQVNNLQAKPRYIITEALPSQHHPLAMLARHAGYALEEVAGYVQLFVLM